jgi:hypothetical protein
MEGSEIMQGWLWIKRTQTTPPLWSVVCGWMFAAAIQLNRYRERIQIVPGISVNNWLYLSPRRQETTLNTSRPVNVSLTNTLNGFGNYQHTFTTSFGTGTAITEVTRVRELERVANAAVAASVDRPVPNEAWYWKL